MSKILFLIFFLYSFFFSSPVLAQGQSFVSIINPIRGNDFWEERNQKPKDAVYGQADILQQYNATATWLIRYDVLNDQEIINILNSLPGHEKGIFLEVTPSWAKEANTKYHISENWHEAGSAFLSGYEREERKKLIDQAFTKFKQVFDYYPTSVGAWWIDAYSLEYMYTKYAINSALIVADQYSTDNYQIWGQYFGTPYYPSKKHALHPAQTKEDKLPVVMMQWAVRDPVNGYGKGVEESTYSLQANDYIDYHKQNIKYFSSLIDIYTKQPFNKVSQVVVGLENSYSWEKYGSEYKKQIETLVEKEKIGQFRVVTMSDFAKWYKNAFPDFSPTQLIVAEDPLGGDKKTVWFMNPYYRVGWFFNRDGSVFRDIRQYIDGEEELCFKARCDSVNFATSATRVLDEVSFGRKWIIDQGKISDFKVNKQVDKYTITYKNEAGKERSIEFLPRDISVDGQISSIDTTILEITKKDLSQIKNGQKLEKGFVKWSLIDLLSTSISFILFLILAVLIPGLVLTRKMNLFISTTFGLVCLTLVFYVASILKFKLLVPIYILVNLLLFFRLRLFKNFPIPNFTNKSNLLSVGIILVGTVFQSLPTVKNGLIYPYGLGLWGPNTHDGIWHVALINQLIKGVPVENPIFAGTILKNYHFFYDLLVAATNFLSGIPVLDLVFRFYPILFSLILGVGTYYLIVNLFRQKTAAFFSLYLVYFAGSFGWIVEYLKVKHLGGESAFWANQSISFNLNPPFAISLLIIIAILQTLPNLKVQKNAIFILTILCGTLVAFKAYAGILMITTLLLIALVRRSWSYLILFLNSTIVSGLLFLSNFSMSSNLIIFSPFWFIHSMIDSPDRVGWTRLTLARVAGLEQGNWFKFFSSEIISLFLFIVGNLGTRAFALFSLLKLKIIFRQTEYLFLFIFSSLALLIPILFIQTGNPWNTIQFIYYFLYTSALVSGIVISKIVSRLNKSIALIFILSLMILTPINSWATANSYLSYQPHARVGQNELQALQFLASLDDGIVLTYPYDEQLKRRLSEPWPLVVYDSTAYVSALTKKAVFLEDEPQNQILLTDYKKRLVASRDFFLSPTQEQARFLSNNNIKYIYIPKIFNQRLDESPSDIKNIFENDQVIIYKFRD